MTVRIRLLGGFEVSIDGTTHTEQAWSRRQAASLVKALALEPRGRLHREQLIDRLWPHLHPETAAPRLHKAAHYARRVLGDGSVVLDRETVSLFPADPPTVDVHEFTALATAAVAATDPDLAVEAADRYGGELLPDDRYVEWLEPERERLTRLYVEVLRAAGRWEAILAADPADEEAHLTLAHRLARAGDRNGALRQFERLERALRQELGVGLSPSAAALRTRVLRMPAPAAPAPAERRTGPLVVGRDAQTTRMGALLEEVRTGRGRTLFVSGPAGIGKTTLLVDLERRAEQLGVRVGTATAAATEGAWPFAPVLEALADLSRRHPALLDGLDDGMRQEIERALAGRSSPWAGANTHQRLFVACAELLRLAAAGPGALLVVDDVGLADDASLKLLHYLARATSAEHVLLAFGHRFPPAPALARLRNALLGRSAAVTIDLGPLDRDAATALVRARLPDAPDDLVAAWHTATGGSPFELAELARAVARGEPAAPATLLPPDTPAPVVDALAQAAVLGMRFDTDELQALTGASDADTFALVDAGIEHHILDRGPGCLRFRHPLLRNALLTRLGPGREPAVHARAARALDSLGRSPARVGRHLLEANDPVAAVPYLVRAAETEGSLGAYNDALATVSSVRPHATGEELARLLALRADLLLAKGDRAAGDAYREALAVVTDPRARAHLRVGLARTATYAADYETARVALEGLEPDGGPGDAELMLARGLLAYLTGDLATADGIVAEARRRLAFGGGGAAIMFELVALQGLLAHHRGQWFQQLDRELHKAADDPGAAVGLFDSYLCAAEYILYGTTPHAEVMELAAELRASAERAGVLRVVAFATALRGEAALLTGDLDLAEEELRESADLHHDLGSTAGEAHALQRLGDIHLARGDREQATVLATRALPLARWSTIALHLLQRIYGTLVYAAPDPDEALAVVDRAEAAMGFDDECLFCQIMFVVPAGHAAAAVGDLDRCRGYLGRAREMADRWEGTVWHAMVLELEAHLAQVQGRDDVARALLARAAETFAGAGHMLDAERCRRGGRASVATRTAPPTGVAG